MHILLRRKAFPFDLQGMQGIQGLSSAWLEGCDQECARQREARSRTGQGKGVVRVVRLWAGSRGRVESRAGGDIYVARSIY